MGGIGRKVATVVAKVIVQLIIVATVAVAATIGIYWYIRKQHTAAKFDASKHCTRSGGRKV